MTNREFIEEVAGIIGDTAYTTENCVEAILDKLEEGDYSARDAAEKLIYMTLRLQSILDTAIDTFKEQGIVSEDEILDMEEIVDDEVQTVIERNNYEQFIRSLFPKDCDAKVFVVDSCSL